MALQLSYDDQFGSTHASAYHRVVNFTVSRERDFVSLFLATYVDAAARQADKEPLIRRKYRVAGDDYDTYFSTSALDVADQNVIERGYVYLKTLSEFSGASDV